MTLLGLDAFGHPPASAVREQGFSFVICYVGIPGNPKCVDLATFDSYVAAGIQVGFVFESTATRATEGFAAGVADAGAVGAYMKYLGLSGDMPLVFYAVDADVTFAQVEPYFEGVTSVHAADAYGDYQVVHQLMGNNLVTEVWQTAAWSHGVIEPNAAVFQRVGTVVVGGVQCDVNQAESFGQWAYPGGVMTNPADIFNYAIPKQGFNDDGTPATGQTTLGQMVAWSDQSFHASAAILKPSIQDLSDRLTVMEQALADIKTALTQGITSVSLTDAEKQDLKDEVRTVIGDVLKGAATAIELGLS